MTYLIELQAYLTTLVPFWLTVLIGHGLPLCITAWCLWSLRKDFTRARAIAFTGAVLVTAAFFDSTATLHDHPGGRSISFSVQFAAMLTLICACARGSVPSARVVWAVSFIGLWMVDTTAAARFIGPHALWSAVGGGGLLDALVLAPTLAVLAVGSLKLARLVAVRLQPKAAA